MHAAHHYAAGMLLIPSGMGGEKPLPPRSAATKSARARGLADLIDNLGAALSAAPSF
jgi:hypothetical protein